MLGKFQGLVLDNRDLEDLARWLPRPAEPSAGTGDRRLHMDDGGTVVPTERKSPRGNGLSTMLLAALASGGEAVGVDGPMSPTGLSIFSSDSNTTYAEEVCVCVCLFVRVSLLNIDDSWCCRWCCRWCCWFCWCWCYCCRCCARASTRMLVIHYTVKSLFFFSSVVC